MTPAQYAAVLTKRGETMVLRRLGGASVTLKGKRHDAAGDPLVGNVGQIVVKVIISNAEIAAAGWPGPPRQGDKLTMGGIEYTLLANADTRSDSGKVYAHFLQVKG